ncbi:MAG: hypothetical protein HFP77_00175 [Methylococcales symbiont of Iophon sp. n. MRB-2018]|nr:MAG: hypothetical protein HFP77_00175 [Methylococcales symbiont of Iophon sp. n. MRB-2018]KAF3980376.1 MAG: hypothetical protein HFP76_02335 [Methylococcales symbiont of Iophon sp. n. MRB-2018]
MLFSRKKKTYLHDVESQRHVEGFHSLVKYLVRLRREGTIDNEVFEELMAMSSALFVEAEVTERIDKILEDKISTDYLMELFL